MTPISMRGNRDHEYQHTMISKMKKRLIRLSSTAVRVVMPSNRAKSRRTIGSSDMRTASNTGDRIPEIIPMTESGNLQIQASQLYVVHSDATFDTAPTNATTFIG